MKSKTMALLVLLGLALAIGVAAAQKNKPWTEWTMQDAEKILNQSGWGQTQTETDTTETYFTPGARPIDSRGAMNQATGVNYRIRFLSAKPIRQAFLRILELNPTKSTPQQTELMRQYVRFQADCVLADMGYAPLFRAENPFPFMDKLTLNEIAKTNFFEARPTQYQKVTKEGASRFAVDNSPVEDI